MAYLKASLRRKRDLNQSLVLSVAQVMKGALNLKPHFATVFVNDFHRFVGSGSGAGSFPEQRVPTDNENRREMGFKV